MLIETWFGSSKSVPYEGIFRYPLLGRSFVVHLYAGNLRLPWPPTKYGLTKGSSPDKALFKASLGGGWGWGSTLRFHGVIMDSNQKIPATSASKNWSDFTMLRWPRWPSSSGTSGVGRPDWKSSQCLAATELGNGGVGGETHKNHKKRHMFKMCLGCLGLKKWIWSNKNSQKISRMKKKS